MESDTTPLEERLAKLDNEFPLVPHTCAGRLFSSVRRMKAEQEMDIPIHLRSAFAVSARTGKAADNMAEQEWQEFCWDLSERLKRDCPQLYVIEDLLVEAEVLHQRLEVIVLFFKLRQATQFSKPKPASFFQR